MMFSITIGYDLSFSIGKVIAVKTDIRVLFFDHGGVLTPGGEKGANEKAAARAMGLSAISASKLNEALKRGEITNEEFVAGVNDSYPNAPHKLTPMVWTNIYEAMTLDGAAYDFAYWCQELGYKIGILTNINPVVARMLECNGAYRNFHVVASCYVKCAKPDPGIYEYAQAQFPDYQPHQFVMIDDQQTCVDGATRLGWNGVRVDNTQQMIRDVSRLLEI